MTASQDARWKAELAIIQEIGRIPSSREMQKLLLEKYGIKANHNIINSDLKKDLEALTPQEYENQKGGILKMLDTEITLAHNIATTDPDSSLKLKAMNTVSKLSKTKTGILIKFRQAHARLAKEEQAAIHVFIGTPEEVDLSKHDKVKKETPESDEKTD